MNQTTENLWKLFPQEIVTRPLINGRREPINLKTIAIQGVELYAAAEAKPGLPLGTVLATLLDGDEGEPPTFPNLYPDGLHAAERSFAYAQMNTALNELQEKTWTGPRAETLRRRKRKLGQWQQSLGDFIAMLFTFVDQVRSRAVVAIEDPDRAGDWGIDKDFLQAMIIPPYAVWFRRVRQALELGQFQDVVHYCDLIKLRPELESHLWFFGSGLELTARTHCPELIGDLANRSEMAMRVELIAQVRDKIGGLIRELKLTPGSLDKVLRNVEDAMIKRSYDDLKQQLELALNCYDQLAMMDWR